MATKAPYLSQQLFYNSGKKIPAVRPVSSYLGVTYNPQSLDIISNRRPGFTWDVACVINAYIESCKTCNWRVWYPEELGESTSWGNWTQHRAALMIPYGWLQTITFYEFIAMAMPTLVPDQDLMTMFVTSAVTNIPDFNTTISPPSSADYPYDCFNTHMSLESYQYSNAAREYWTYMLDYTDPGSGLLTFGSVSHMIVQLQENDLLEVSRQMGENNKKWQARAEIFWDDAVKTSMDIVHTSRHPEENEIRSKLDDIYRNIKDNLASELHSEF